MLVRKLNKFGRFVKKHASKLGDSPDYLAVVVCGIATGWELWRRNVEEEVPVSLSVPVDLGA